jgi:hypothetical protein
MVYDEQTVNYPGKYSLKIICGQIHGVCFTGCGSTLLLKPNNRQCCGCIYRHAPPIRAMVNDVASSASDGSFAPPYFDIWQVHHEKSISQWRGSSSAMVQLLF